MSLNISLGKLKKYGFNPESILDIGAHKGLWTRQVQSIFPESKFLLMDANEYKEIQTCGHEYKILLLNDEEKDVEWYEIMGTGDSIFKEVGPHYRDVLPKIRKSYTLDSQVHGRKFEMIKLDVQGAEIAVLKGATETLKYCNVLVLEMPFCAQYNEKSPTFADYVSYLNSIGFAPFDVSELHYLGSVLIQMDIIFIRLDSDIIRRIQQDLNSR